MNFEWEYIRIVGSDFGVSENEKGGIEFLYKKTEGKEDQQDE